MKTTLRNATVASVIAMAALGGAAHAETLRWAQSGDALTLDPHAQNSGQTHTLAHQMYEPLLQRDMEGAIIPTLATEWGPTDNPNVWEFKLREGVSFHGGEAFTADDVVFSLNRAMMPTSDMKALLNSVEEVRKVDDYTVHIETKGPNPLLPNNLTNMFIMDSGWAMAQGCEAPQDFANGGDNACVREVNGTGAFELVSRLQDQRTLMTRNENYWGKGTFPMEVQDIVFTPIQESATRVSALLSGEIDIIQDVPVQDLARVGGTSGLKVDTGPQNRVIFFGMNSGKADLESDTVDGKNPFADLRVRQAMNIAINREAIKKVVMREQSAPAGVIMPPFVNGWTEALDAYPAYDVNAAKALMAEAGYEDGFGITLNCPNDRYVNDEAICQAAVGMFGQIGIDVTLDALPKAQHFPLIQNRVTEFYMLGWGVPTFDSEYIFNFLYHTSSDSIGTWNNTGYSDADVDAKIVSLASETDLAKRNATIGDIWGTVQAESIYLPIHHQVLNWGMKENMNFAVQPEDQPHFKFLTFN